ncbi:MAG: hypothetical protein ACYCZ6_02690 [Polaromonas sp.]
MLVFHFFPLGFFFIILPVIPVKTALICTVRPQRAAKRESGAQLPNSMLAVLHAIWNMKTRLLRHTSLPSLARRPVWLRLHAWLGAKIHRFHFVMAGTSNFMIFP